MADIMEKILARTTLRDRISGLCKLPDQSDAAQVIADYANISSVEIESYLSGQSPLRLPDVGRLIIALKKFFGSDDHLENWGGDITIEKLASDLPKAEYRALRMGGKTDLIEALSKEIPKDAKTFSIDRLYVRYLLGDEPPDGYIPLSLGGSASCVDNALDNWCSEKGESSTFILSGEVGSGKTTALSSFVARRAERYRADPETEPVPILISIRSFEKGIDPIGDIIRDISSEFFRGKAPNKEDAFWHLVQENRILPVIDGLDLWSDLVSTDDQSKYDTLMTLEKLSYGRMIVACNLSAPDDKVLFDFFEPNIKTNFHTCSKEVIIKSLRPIHDCDVGDWVKLYAKAEHEAALEKIKRIPNGLFLCSNPLILSMLVPLLPNIPEDEPLTKADIFARHIDGWRMRENKNQDDLETMMTCCTTVAKYLWERKTGMARLGLIIKDLPSSMYSSTANFGATMKNLRSFDPLLVWNETFRFKNRSFLHYFLARVALKEPGFDGTRLDGRKLPEGALDFIRDLKTETRPSNTGNKTKRERKTPCPK